MSMVKASVFYAVEGELEHQEKIYPRQAHTAGEWILILEKLCADARQVWVTTKGDTAALHEVRKITAVGLRCLGQCGAPKRGDPVTK